MSMTSAKTTPSNTKAAKTGSKDSAKKDRTKKSRRPDVPVTVVPHGFGGSEISIGNLVDISFQRTLRVAETGINALPPGLGLFPLRSVDALGDRVTADIRRRGGVILPIYQREAMWLSFSADVPVAIQIASGLRCAVTGDELENRLRHRKQNFIDGSAQPWIDGFKTESGEVRQFVAARLGDGATVEEQLSDTEPVGGVQIVVWELTDEALERWLQRRRNWVSDPLDFGVTDCVPFEPGVCYSMSVASPSYDMGLGAGGVIKQEIYRSAFSKSDWRSEPSARVWVHLVDANSWTSLTGEPQPSTPVTAAEYAKWGLPWFDYFDADRVDVDGSPTLAGVRTVGEILGGHDDGAVMHPAGAPVVSLGRTSRPQPVVTPNWD